MVYKNTILIIKISGFDGSLIERLVHVFIFSDLCKSNFRGGLHIYNGAVLTQTIFNFEGIFNSMKINRTVTVYFSQIVILESMGQPVQKFSVTATEENKIYAKTMEIAGLVATKNILGIPVKKVNSGNLVPILRF